MKIETFLQQSPMFAVTLAARRFDALAARALAGGGLSFTEGLILSALFFESPHPVRPSRLARSFETTRGAISHSISSLESKGLVQRKIDPNDARSYQLTLKPQGKKAAIAVIGALDAMQRDFEQEIGAAPLLKAIQVVHRLGVMSADEG